MTTRLPIPENHRQTNQHLVVPPTRSWRGDRSKLQEFESPAHFRFMKEL